MQERRSTTLAPEDWERLDNLAALTQSTATTGTSAGQPTWRALLRRICRNDEIMNFIEATLTATQQAQSSRPEQPGTKAQGSVSGDVETGG